MAMGLGIAHPGGTLERLNIDAFARQPGGLHTDAVLKVHRIDIMGIHIKLNKISELAHFNGANLVFTAQNEGCINRLSA